MTPKFKSCLCINSKMATCSTSYMSFPTQHWLFYFRCKFWDCRSQSMWLQSLHTNMVAAAIHVRATDLWKVKKYRQIKFDFLFKQQSWICKTVVWYTMKIRYSWEQSHWGQINCCMQFEDSEGWSPCGWWFHVSSTATEKWEQTATIQSAPAPCRGTGTPTITSGVLSTPRCITKLNQWLDL